jgi:uncharacterized RDD family membrane protein YckC
MLDSALRVATPEGVELTLRLAGPVPRALAWALDLCWRLAAMIVIAILLGPLGRFGGALALLAAFALEWLVPAFCEVWFAGATPGKKALGLQVLRDDGSPVTWGPALTRNFLRFADFLPLLYAGGLCSMLFHPQFKRLGDLAAGTIVVHRDPPAAARRIMDTEPVRAPVPLALEDRRALLDFAERASLLGSARAEELAEIPETLLEGRRGSAAVTRLCAIANQLHGRPGSERARRAPG